MRRRTPPAATSSRGRPRRSAPRAPGRAVRTSRRAVAYQCPSGARRAGTGDDQHGAGDGRRHVEQDGRWVARRTAHEVDVEAGARRNRAAACRDAGDGASSPSSGHGSGTSRPTTVTGVGPNDADQRIVTSSASCDGAGAVDRDEQRPPTCRRRDTRSDDEDRLLGAGEQVLGRVVEQGVGDRPAAVGIDHDEDTVASGEAAGDLEDPVGPGAVAVRLRVAPWRVDVDDRDRELGVRTESPRPGRREVAVVPVAQRHHRAERVAGWRRRPPGISGPVSAHRSSSVPPPPVAPVAGTAPEANDPRLTVDRGRVEPAVVTFGPGAAAVRGGPWSVRQEVRDGT